jgi:hypothetical protein
MSSTKRQGIPAKVKVAIAFLVERQNDMRAAAEFAGLSVYELRRSLMAPHIRRYALEQRQVALEAFCLGSRRPSPRCGTSPKTASRSSMP